MQKTKKKGKRTGRFSLTELFSRGLVRIRLAEGLSQVQLAARANLAHSYISLLEHGERSPTLQTIDALAGAMGKQGISFFKERSRAI